jgi:hypothetical protein
MVYITHKNGDFGDGLWHCFNHISWPILVAVETAQHLGSGQGRERSEKDRRESQRWATAINWVRLKLSNVVKTMP